MKLFSTVAMETGIIKTRWFTSSFKNGTLISLLIICIFIHLDAERNLFFC